MPKEMKCPVCQKSTDESVLAVEYEGELYAFCCPYCRERFIEDNELGLEQLLMKKKIPD